ncbi:MAG: septum formation initiator family protein [bacterium]
MKKTKKVHTDLRPSKKTIKPRKAIKSNPKQLYYLFISFVLGLCLFQAVRGATLNSFKFLTLNKQCSELKYIHRDAKEKNDDLKSQLESYTSIKGIEALARNNLKMVGKNEVLVVIKKDHNSQPKNKE